jgi:TPR repeat protein
MHSRGEGGPVDLVEARRLVGLAAAQGHTAAQCSLGILARDGECEQGVDLVEARRLFGLAAAQGLMLAQFNLAGLLYDGEGGPKDMVEARRMMVLAAAHEEDTTPKSDLLDLAKAHIGL